VAAPFLFQKVQRFHCQRGQCCRMSNQATLWERLDIIPALGAVGTHRKVPLQLIPKVHALYSRLCNLCSFDRSISRRVGRRQLQAPHYACYIAQIDESVEHETSSVGLSEDLGLCVPELMQTDISQHRLNNCTAVSAKSRTSRHKSLP